MCGRASPPRSPSIPIPGGLGTALSPASARRPQSEFSLLPAENTSGNWVKVVQRIPLRVQIDTAQKGMPSLRAGMSVEVTVDTGHKRGLPHVLTTLFGDEGRG